MYGMTNADKIWNRAMLHNGGPDAREGDRALASLSYFHNFAMNGGALHAYECLTEAERKAAASGYQYFGLEDAAKVLEWLDEQLADAHGTEDERLEAEANVRYPAAMDDAIWAAFQTRFKADPDAFAPPT